MFDPSSDNFKFRIGKEIGLGSFAKVREAQLVLDKEKPIIKAAVKIIDPYKAPAEFKQKFLPRELEIASKIQHSNIIKIFTVKVDKYGRLFVFMELAERGDMVDYLKANGPVVESVAKRWTHQLVDALSYCHRLGIAHRDVKCENLLLDIQLNLKLTDFGFARYCKDVSKHNRILSRTWCGSAAYVAPEVLKQQPYNPFRADVWSLGVCLYVMMNNSTPFDDTSMTLLLRQQLGRTWRITMNGKSLSSRGVDFLRRCLEPNVVRRPPLNSLLEHAWFKFRK